MKVRCPICEGLIEFEGAALETWHECQDGEIVAVTRPPRPAPMSLFEAVRAWLRGA